MIINKHFNHVSFVTVLPYGCKNKYVIEPGDAAVKDGVVLSNSNCKNHEGARRFYYAVANLILKRNGTNDTIIKLDNSVGAFKQEISSARGFGNNSRQNC